MVCAFEAVHRLLEARRELPVRSNSFSSWYRASVAAAAAWRGVTGIGVAVGEFHRVGRGAVDD